MPDPAKPEKRKGRSHLNAFVESIDLIVAEAGTHFTESDVVYNRPTPPIPGETPITAKPDTQRQRQGERLGESQGERLDVRLDAQPDAKALVKPVAKAHAQPIAQSVAKAMTTPIAQPVAKALVKPDDQPALRIISPLTLVPRLTSRQDSVLRILYQKYTDALRTGVTPHANRTDLAALAGLTYGSVHTVIRALKKYGYFTTPAGQVHITNYTGFVIQMNEDMCSKYFSIYNEDDAKAVDKANAQPMVKPDAKAEDQAEVKPLVKAVSSSSSYSLNIKTTTIEEVMEQVRAMEYWQKDPNVVTKRHVQDWVIKTKVSLEFVPLYLERCEYHMVDMGKEKELDKPAINYFYSVLKASSSYPEYKGFKSREEKRLEEEKRILEKKEKERAEREELWLKTEFYKMMDDPGCEMYRTCLGRITEFARNMGHENPDSMAFHNSMFAEFKNIKYGVSQGLLFEANS